MADLGSFVAIGIAAYLIGSFPTAYLIVRRFAGKNILELGTGNVGTLNVLRATNSKLLMLANLVGDVLKGVLAMLVGYGVASAAGGDTGAGVATGGIISVVGHNYSVFLKFQGGKGIATALPVLFVLEPVLVAVWIGTFLLTAATTRILVLGQILGTVVVPIVGYVQFEDSALSVSVLAIIVFVRHASRIPSVLKGTEPKLYYKIDETQEA